MKNDEACGRKHMKFKKKKKKSFSGMVAAGETMLGNTFKDIFIFLLSLLILVQKSKTASETVHHTKKVFEPNI